MYRKKSRIGSFVCLIINMVTIYLSFSIVVLLIKGFTMTKAELVEYYMECSVMVLLWALIFLVTDVFHRFFKRGLFEELVASIKMNIYVFLAFMTVQFFFELAGISKLVMLMFPVINTVMIWLFNVLYKKVLLKGVKNRKNTNQCILLVNKSRAEEVIENMVTNVDFNHRLTGFIVYEEDWTGKEINGVPCLAAGNELIEYCKSNVVDEVFIHLNDTNEDVVKNIIDELSIMGINSLLNLKEFDWEVNSKRTLERVGFYTVMVFSNNIISPVQYMLKRTLDVCAGIVGVLVCIVIGIILAPAIIIEDGFPIIFKQQRVGRNGRVFNFYKFRSMYRDAEARKAELMEQNEMKGLMFKMENDPRVTKVGRFIRKTSLDEFPQFFNILKGDMSLVGTRPPTIQEYEQYSPHHKKRLSFRPGLTGNWQVNGRSNIDDFEEVVRLDVEYMEDWSFKKDIHILLKTVKMVIMGKGAK